MKAFRSTAYGVPSHNNLEIQEVPIPTNLKKDQVLIKVDYASLNGGDFHLVKGDPFPIRFMAGLFKPKIPAVGSDVAGKIVKVGPKKNSESESQWKIGDRVLADFSKGFLFGAVAEYAVANEEALTKIPDGVTIKDAAALPVAGATAYGALRAADTKANEKVLIVGASGGVGHFAVQIAKKHLKCATVTGVCSGKNVDLVKSLGADVVIDYTVEGNFYDNPKYQQEENQFDVILDCANDNVATDDPQKSLACLKPGGRYMMIAGKNLMSTIVWGSSYARKAGEGKKAKTYDNLFGGSKDACQKLVQMVEREEVKPYIGAEFELVNAVEGLKIMDSGRAQGKILIKMPNTDSESETGEGEKLVSWGEQQAKNEVSI